MAKKSSKGFSSLFQGLANTSLTRFQDAQLGLFPDIALNFKKSRISKEYQSYGLYLTRLLDDTKHKNLYIKMAKEIDRGILERALSFISDANTTENKARLFMWKVKQLRDEKKAKQEIKKDSDSDAR